MPRTVLQSLTKVAASTLSGILASSTSEIWNSDQDIVFNASLHCSLLIIPSLFKSKRVKMLLISSEEKSPVLKPYYFFNLNCSTMKFSTSSGYLKQIAVQISSKSSLILCFLRYSSALSLR